MSVTIKDFLYNNCKVKGDGKFTHTSMGKGAGSFYVSKEMNNDFIDIYEREVFEHEVPTHINEVSDPNRYSPLKVDLDFKYSMNIPESESSSSSSSSSYSSSDTISLASSKSKGKKKRKNKTKKGKPKAERRYTQIMIQELIKMFYELLKKYIVQPMDEKQYECFGSFIRPWSNRYLLCPFKGFSLNSTTLIRFLFLDLNLEIVC